MTGYCSVSMASSAVSAARCRPGGPCPGGGERHAPAAAPRDVRDLTYKEIVDLEGRVKLGAPLTGEEEALWEAYQQIRQTACDRLRQAEAARSGWALGIGAKLPPDQISQAVKAATVSGTFQERFRQLQESQPDLARHEFGELAQPPTAWFGEAAGAFAKLPPDQLNQAVKAATVSGMRQQQGQEERLSEIWRGAQEWSWPRAEPFRLVLAQLEEQRERLDPHRRDFGRKLEEIKRQMVPSSRRQFAHWRTDDFVRAFERLCRKAPLVLADRAPRDAAGAPQPCQAAVPRRQGSRSRAGPDSDSSGSSDGVAGPGPASRRQVRRVWV